MGYFTTALEDPHLLAELPNPHRILTVAIPFVDPKGKKLIYPGPGYDPHFHTYLIHGAPQIDHSMSVSKAKEILAKIHEEFCFENDQSPVSMPTRESSRLLRAEFSTTGVSISRPESRFGSSGRTDPEPARTIAR